MPGANSISALTRPGQSNVRFSPAETKLMVTDIKDILGRLKDKGVADFNKPQAIRLLNSNQTLIEFIPNELTEVKRFTSLIHSSFLILTHLVRNPSSDGVIREVERRNRVMGSINFQKTRTILQQNPTERIVICNEIHKTMDTPENIITAQILYSIAVQCNKYLSNGGRLKSGACLDNPTLQLLAFIRAYTMDLLSTKTMRNVLPTAISNLSNFESLFSSVIERIYLTKVPRYFIGIINLLYTWKYFVWIANRNIPLLDRLLFHYFFNLKDDDNQLYECWVLYKILEEITSIPNLKFRESNSSHGGVTFRSFDGSISVTYQGTYETGWMRQETPIQDRPDLVVEINKRPALILDAKNSDLALRNSTTYREQMDSYLRSVGKGQTDYGIFIFSLGEREHWDEIRRGSQKILCMTLSPKSDKNNETLNQQTLQTIIELVKTLRKVKNNKIEL